MPGTDGEHELDAEHQVTPLELFFDLTFVFAMTQVTVLLADDPTWSGVFRGMLVREHRVTIRHPEVTA